MISWTDKMSTVASMFDVKSMYVDFKNSGSEKLFFFYKKEL